jgi:hypothetical protein
MAGAKLSVIRLVLASIFLVQSAAFNLVQRRSLHAIAGPITTILNTKTPKIPLLGTRPLTHRRVQQLFMTTEDPNKEPTENEITKSENSSSEDDADGAEEKPSISRTVLLTVPLFCKFAIVLLIKFLTDLVVFPLLFLYRIAGQVKRKFLKLIGKGKLNDGEPANGASKQ